MDLREAPHEGARRHPWEVARFRFFAGVLGRAGAFRRPSELLDVGSGDAWFASQILAKMAPGSRVTCWDVGYEHAPPGVSNGAIEFVHARPGARKDLIVLLDVLEHVDDDARFLGDLVRENARPGALVLVSVPAWHALFSARDVFLKHHRRYTPSEGRALLDGAGLAIEKEGGLFHSLLVPRALTKAKETVLAAIGHTPTGAGAPAWSGGPALTRAVLAALAADNAFSHALADRGLRVPGLSWWALCKAP